MVTHSSANGSKNRSDGQSNLLDNVEGEDWYEGSLELQGIPTYRIVFVIGRISSPGLTVRNLVSTILDDCTSAHCFSYVIKPGQPSELSSTE